MDAFLVLLGVAACIWALTRFDTPTADAGPVDPFVALPAAFEEAQPRVVRASRISRVEPGPAGWSRVWLRGQPHALGVARSYEDLLEELRG